MRDACPHIADLNQHAVALGRAGGGIGGGHVARLHREGAAARHRIARVDRQIDDDLLDLRQVRQHGPQIAPIGDVETHRLAKQAVEHDRKVSEHVVEVEDGGPQRLPAREGEELLDEPRRALGVLLDVHDVAERGVRRAVVLQQKVREADDGRQHVVEVVRDPAGELADGLHLLALRDLGFQLGLLGHVGDGEDEQRPPRSATALAERRTRRPGEGGMVRVDARKPIGCGPARRAGSTRRVRPGRARQPDGRPRRPGRGRGRSQAVAPVGLGNSRRGFRKSTRGNALNAAPPRRPAPAVGRRGMRARSAFRRGSAWRPACAGEARPDARCARGRGGMSRRHVLRMALRRRAAWSAMALASSRASASGSDGAPRAGIMVSKRCVDAMSDAVGCRERERCVRGGATCARPCATRCPDCRSAPAAAGSATTAPPAATTAAATDSADRPATRARSGERANGRKGAAMRWVMLSAVRGFGWRRRPRRMDLRLSRLLPTERLGAVAHRDEGKWPGAAPGSIVPVDAFPALMALLRLDGQCCDGPRIETLQADGLAGLLAIAVGAVLDPREGRSILAISLRCRSRDLSSIA